MRFYTGWACSSPSSRRNQRLKAEPQERKQNSNNSLSIDRMNCAMPLLPDTSLSLLDNKILARNIHPIHQCLLFREETF